MDHKSLSRKALGELGESLAVEHLRKAGLQILMRNYRCPKGEIDIIAQDGDWLVCVEVRSKTSGTMGLAEESIDRKKIQKLRNTAAYYLMEKGYREWPLLRLDLIALYFYGYKDSLNYKHSLSHSYNHSLRWIKGIM